MFVIVLMILVLIAVLALVLLVLKNKGDHRPGDDGGYSDLNGDLSGMDDTRTKVYGEDQRNSDTGTKVYTTNDH